MNKGFIRDGKIDLPDTIANLYLPQKAIEVYEEKKSNQSQVVITDGQEVQSVSLPAETASQTASLPKPKQGKPNKVGK